MPPSSSKTGGGRAVPLRNRGKLRGVPLRIPGNWESRWRRLRRAAGFAPGQWVPDVCRHTFASYHAAYFRDLGALQLEMDHRCAHLLLSRYLNLPQVNQTWAYWNIRCVTLLCREYESSRLCRDDFPTKRRGIKMEYCGYARALLRD